MSDFYSLPPQASKRYVVIETGRKTLEEIFKKAGLKHVYDDDERIRAGRGYAEMTVILTQPEHDRLTKEDGLETRPFRPRAKNPPIPEAP